MGCASSSQASLQVRRKNPAKQFVSDSNLLAGAAPSAGEASSPASEVVGGKPGSLSIQKPSESALGDDQNTPGATSGPPRYYVRVVGVDGIPVSSLANPAKNGWFVRICFDRSAADAAQAASKDGKSSSSTPRESSSSTKKVPMICTSTQFSATGDVSFLSDRGWMEAKDGMTNELRLRPESVNEIHIQLCSAYFEHTLRDDTKGLYKVIGETTVSVTELLTRQSWKLWLFTPPEELLMFGNEKKPTYLKLDIVPEGNAPTPSQEPPKEAVYDRKVMVITRGTRGDVQPFVALARGMAEQRNYDVTIVTEMRYRDIVVKNSKVSRGRIRFRCSGGDTELRIDSIIAKWFIMQPNLAFQYLMLARAEREFFASEPAFHYWAEVMRPDLILFGFCTANLSMLISESLKIPIVGVILQPTIIPSSKYPPVIPIGRNSTLEEQQQSAQTGLDLREAVESHHRHLRGGVSEGSKQSAGGNSSIEEPTQMSENWIRCDLGKGAPEEEGELRLVLSAPGELSGASTTSLHARSKNFIPHTAIGILRSIMENNVFTRRLNTMRASHGLGRAARLDSDFSQLQDMRVPLVVPISPLCFGGRPMDWGPSTVMTDFIFLSAAAPTTTATSPSTPAVSSPKPLSSPKPRSEEPGAPPPIIPLSPGNVVLPGEELLTPALASFLRKAKLARAPVVAIAFSSMPVSRTAVLGLSSLVIEKSERGVRVIALVGKRPSGEVTDAIEEGRASRYANEGKLIEVQGAPFGVLFPLCDFVVTHGGLGSTSEAFRAGKPCVVTGVLLFDQRFWGKRVFDLGVGPAPVHISNLRSHLVEIVDRGVTPGNPWAVNAMQLSAKLAAFNHGDGVDLNINAICDAKAVVIRSTGKGSGGSDEGNGRRAEEAKGDRLPEHSSTSA